MFYWSIPAPQHIRIASGTFHTFSPCLTETANVPLFYHLILDAAFALTVFFAVTLEAMFFSVGAKAASRLRW